MPITSIELKPAPQIIASSGLQLTYNGVGNGLNWGPVTPLPGVGVDDFWVEITM